MLQYAQKRANGIQDLEKRLSDFGYRVGIRVLELQVARGKPNRRENRVLGILYFIHSNMWKVLFEKQADSLEKGTENDDEYMISDNEPQISKFISIPKELSVLNAACSLLGS
ncbi:NO signaling/Golgi transport ligand-binding domain-containing protein [Cladochytrium replicatum]|nr:NO signaling/Golgi transport ligand-binding domain-containing protein [Cladochytrium replicatum]